MESNRDAWDHVCPASHADRSCRLTAASLALDSAYGLEKPAALNGPQFLSSDVLTQVLVVDNGIAQLPSGPALGIEADEERLAAVTGRGPGDVRGERELPDMPHAAYQFPPFLRAQCGKLENLRVF